MISLRLFSIIILTLCCREFAGNEPTLTVARAITVTLGSVLLFGLLVKFLAFLSLAQTTNAQTSYQSVYASFANRRKWSEMAWLLLLPIILIATGWGGWVNYFEHEGIPKTLCVLAYFFPTLLVVLLAEITSSQFDELRDCTGERKWTDHLRVRLRLGDFAGLLTCITPVLLITFASEVGNWLGGDTGSAWMSVAGFLLIACGFLLYFPSLLSKSMGADRIGDLALQRRLEHYLNTLKFQGLKIMQIPSNGRWAGAAVLGWFRGYRVLWLGDALIDGLSDRQLDMVVMHELAHVRRQHHFIRFLPLVWTTAAGSAVWLLGQFVFDLDSIATNAASLTVSSSLLIASLGYTSRRCELDADRYACHLASQALPWSRENPETAAQVLASALNALLGHSKESQRSTWLHPSLSDRIGQLAAIR